MAEVGRLGEHAGATAVDHGDPVGPPEPGRLRVGAAGTGTPMKPHVPDAKIDALLHRGRSLIRGGTNDNGVDAAGDGFEVGLEVG